MLLLNRPDNHLIFYEKMNGKYSRISMELVTAIYQVDLILQLLNILT